MPAKEERSEIYGVLVRENIMQSTKLTKSTGACSVGKQRAWREAVAVRVFTCACACQRLALSGPGNVGWLCF